MFLLLVEGGLILVGLIGVRWRALGLPVAVMALYLAQGAISNQLGTTASPARCQTAVICSS